MSYFRTLDEAVLSLAAHLREQVMSLRDIASRLAQGHAGLEGGEGAAQTEMTTLPGAWPSSR